MKPARAETRAGFRHRLVGCAQRLLLAAGTLASDNLQPTLVQVVPALGWRDLDLLPFGVWSGRPRIDKSGGYRFDVGGDGMVSVWLDGRLAGSRGVEGTPGSLDTLVELAPGERDLEVRFQARYPDTTFELYWQPPDAGWALVPPNALAPPAGTSWPAGG